MNDFFKVISLDKCIYIRSSAAWFGLMYLKNKLLPRL